MQAAAEEEEDQPGVPAPRPPQVQVLHPLSPLKQPGPHPHTEMDSGQGFSANTVCQGFSGNSSGIFPQVQVLPPLRPLLQPGSHPHTEMDTG